MKMNISELSKEQKDRIQAGLDKYTKIQQQVRTVDVSVDGHFQKLFNSFYRIRRNEEWRRSYYQLFQDIKESGQLDFSYILNEIREKTGRVEASFSSKLLATLNPEMPIWDAIVLQELCLKAPGTSDSRRIEKIKNLYKKIQGWYKSEEAKRCLKAFNKNFPECKDISDVKKIDFYLWGTGK